VVEDRSEPILLFPVRFCCHLHGFGDGNTERAGVIKAFFEVTPTGFCARRRAGEDLCPIGFHDHTAIWLAQEGGIDHEHFQVDPKHLACHCQGTSPLSRTGFSGHCMSPTDLVEKCLRNGGIQLMRTGWRFPLKFKVNMRWSIEFFFKPVGTDKRSWAIEPVDLAHFFRNGHKTLSGYLLFDQRDREKDFKRIFRYQFFRYRVEYRSRCNGTIGVHVVPKARDVTFVQ